MEILLLSGGTPYANFKELAYAWGREKGFHHVLANAVCERRGEVERKKRSDAGRSMTEEEKSAFRTKLQKSRDKNGTSKKAKRDSEAEAEAAKEDDSLDRVQEQALEHQHASVTAEAAQHMKVVEQIIAVDGGPIVDQTIPNAEDQIEATETIGELARAAAEPAPVHVETAASTVPTPEELIPNETAGEVAQL